jgi:hypothetical protein
MARRLLLAARRPETTGRRATRTENETVIEPDIRVKGLTIMDTDNWSKVGEHEICVSRCQPVVAGAS